MQLNDFATRCALHPTMVRRLVALGLVACRRDARGDLWFEPSALVTVGRIQRLRTGLGLNYAAIGLVLDLLDHIEELESASRRRRASRWTSTS
jgi:DNA-binding transcriptional MerR regulator